MGRRPARSSTPRATPTSRPWPASAYDNAATAGTVQSLSTLFKLANVDVEAAAAVPKAELWERMREAASSGEYRLPRIEGSWHRTPFAGVVLIHMTRIPNVDATDPEQLTGPRSRGVGRSASTHRFLRDRVPGFERSVVVATSPAIGVRESRRVHGDYRLTRERRARARRFDDEIALCGAPIEDHGAGGDTDWQYVGDGGVYGIPYRCLLPAGRRGAARRGPLLLRHPRRPRLGALDGDLHGDGPGRRHRGGDGRSRGRGTPFGGHPSAPRAPGGGRRPPRAARAGGSRMTDAAGLRAGPVAEAIRAHRLIVVLRRVERDRLLPLVNELVEAGARIFEVTMDSPDAGDDMRALREHLPSEALVGAGTVMTAAQLDAAQGAGAAFAVSPVLDPTLSRDAVAGGLPWIPGAMTPTEIRGAWEAGATFVKLFPASAVGPELVRELRGPLPEIELIPTGGVDASNARDFLDAGAVAVGIGGALVRSHASARRSLVASLRGERVS